MTAPGRIPHGAASPVFRLHPDGFSSTERRYSEWSHETDVRLLESARPGLAVLRVGQTELSAAPLVLLDAAACRHLARLLDAKADELAGIARRSA